MLIPNGPTRSAAGKRSRVPAVRLPASYMAGFIQLSTAPSLVPHLFASRLADPSSRGSLISRIPHLADPSPRGSLISRIPHLADPSSRGSLISRIPHLADPSPHGITTVMLHPCSLHGRRSRHVLVTCPPLSGRPHIRSTRWDALGGVIHGINHRAVQQHFFWRQNILAGHRLALPRARAHVRSRA